MAKEIDLKQIATQAITKIRQKLNLQVDPNNPNNPAAQNQFVNLFRPQYHPEINLVPDIKNDMIKTLKLRNIVFFICIVVAIGSVSFIAIFGTIAGGQQIAIDSKNQTLENLSEKLNSYSDLNEFLTIKDQLSNIQAITDNKTVTSRTFNILSALLPTGSDTITISELVVNLEEDQPYLTFEANANAGVAPFIDYRVLDAFQKSMEYMNYDYGNYIDKEGNTIPAYCMIEAGSDGATFTESSKGIYAYWLIEGEGCNPSDTLKTKDYTTETYDGEKVVRIWRTPQYSEWYRETEDENKPFMSLDGTISNVPHFESACTTYTGEVSQAGGTPKWTVENQCPLVHDDTTGETNGIKIHESSNGRDTSNELVLRFSATIYLDPEVYKFNNHHMLAVAPSGYRNVTDSYVQLQSMFGERAADCAEDDDTCNSDTTNVNGGNNNG